MRPNRISRLIKICTGTSSDAGEELLQLEGRLEKVVHFWTLVVRHFIKNRCLVRASALAFTSLLALIPLLVVAVGITSSLLKSEGEDQIYHAIDRFVSTLVPPATVENTNGQMVVTHMEGKWAGGPAGAFPIPPVPEGQTTHLASSNVQTNLTLTTAITPPAKGDQRMMTAQWEAARSIHEYIQNAQSGQLGITGMVLFLFTAIGMLRGVESTFNDIWGVTVDRQWWRQISSYFTIVALGPLVLVAAATLAEAPSLHWADHWLDAVPFLGQIVFQVGPLAFLWVMFALFYMLVPNTQVKFSAAFFGGMVAGTLWHLNNIFAFLYVSRVVTNSAIYGKLGLVPVFMLGLYLSWAILLFGAQVAYAFQNRAAYLQDRIADNVNQRGREFVAMRIMALLGQRFQGGLPPAPILDLSSELGVPSRLTQRVLRTLASAGLVTEAAGEDHAFLPARPLDAINAHQILQAMRAGSGQDLLLENTPGRAEIYGNFARIEAAEKAAAEKITVLAMVRRSPVLMALDLPSSTSPTRPVFSNFSDVSDQPAAPAPNERSFANEMPLPAEEKAPDIASNENVPLAETESPQTTSKEVAQPGETTFPL